VIATCDRVERLERAVTSYRENARSHGRDLRIVIADDSRDARGRATNRQMLRRLATETHPLTYFGADEKRRFAEALAEHAGVAPEIARFAMIAELDGGAFPWFTRVGANRNASLLLTAGEAFLAVDDDTTARAWTSPEHDPRARLVAGRDPADILLLEDEPFEAFVRPVDIDVVGAFERLLGPAPSLDALIPVAAPMPWPSIGDARLTARVGSGAARVAAAFPGLVGDFGGTSPFGYWGAPFGSLVLDGPGHDRLVETEDAYHARLTSRTIVRIARSPALSDTDAISAFQALDNRDLLPPYLPVQRGQDRIFARMLWRCFEDTCFGHLPIALTHDPSRRRAFAHAEVTRSASGYDTAKLMIDAVLSCDLPNASGASRLESLGEQLVLLGSMPRAAFEARIGAHASRTTMGLIDWLDGHLRARASAPGYWRSDVNAYIAKLRDSVARPDYAVPLDLVGGGTLAEATASAQHLITAFGRVVIAWPTLVEAARDLLRNGRRFEVAA
jgi:hypothetical protein